VKLLLDENLSHKLVPLLDSVFPGTLHVDGVGMRGPPDPAIWEYAAQNGFILVSKDDDFRQLSFVRGHPPKFIWLLVGNAGTNVIAELLLESRELISAFVVRAEDALLPLSIGERDAL
jgi:predicted nuclease of predicted toxin-antitoxin system